MTGVLTTKRFCKTFFFVIFDLFVFSWFGALPARRSPSRNAVSSTARSFCFRRGANDPTRAVGDVLVREEVFFKPAPWMQFAAGLDLRANSHDQVEDVWRLDFADRGLKRPRASIRRLAATF